MKKSFWSILLVAAFAFGAIGEWQLKARGQQMGPCDIGKGSCFLWGPGGPYSGYCCLSSAPLWASNAGGYKIATSFGDGRQCSSLYEEFNGECFNRVCTSCCGGEAVHQFCVEETVADYNSQYAVKRFLQVAKSFS